MPRDAEIGLRVQLDDNNVPLSMEWSATDAPQSGFRSCDAVLLSFWDPKTRNTLSFDLWTSRMTVDEMNFFVLERMLKLADTHRKATNSNEIAEILSRFGRELAEKLEELAKARAQGSAEK